MAGFFKWYWKGLITTPPVEVAIAPARSRSLSALHRHPKLPRTSGSLDWVSDARSLQPTVGSRGIQWLGGGERE